MYRTYGVQSICIVLLLRHKYSASLRPRMLVALVFRHLRYFGPSGGIGPVSIYQLTKNIKFWLTKGNAPIKLLVYTICIILRWYNLVCTYPNYDQVYCGSLDSINFHITSGSLNWSRLWQNKHNYLFPKRCTEDFTLSIMMQNLKYPYWWWKGAFILKTWVSFSLALENMGIVWAEYVVPTFSRHRYARDQVWLPWERSFPTNKGEEAIYK